MINNVSKYNDYLNEDFFSDFKTNYFKLFQDADEDLNRDFGNYMKKLETENDFNVISKTYNQFLRANQTTFSTKVDSAESIDVVNKLILDNLRIMYFSTLPTVTKFNDQSFTMETIFQKTADKNFKKLMMLPEKKFADGCTQYVNDIMIPEINKKAGIQTQTDQTNNPNTNTQNKTQTPNQTANQQQPAAPTTESYRSVLMRILEADQTAPPTANPPQQPAPAETTEPDKKAVDDLKNYKNTTKNWFNAFYKSLFDGSKMMVQDMTRDTNVNKSIDLIVKTMKNSNNELAKKQLLTKITNMSKDELQKMGDSLGLQKNEIGEF